MTYFQRETDVDQQWGTWGLKQTAGTTDVLNVDPLYIFKLTVNIQRKDRKFEENINLTHTES
jgi:hypothetical protein